MNRYTKRYQRRHKTKRHKQRNTKKRNRISSMKTYKGHGKINPQYLERMEQQLNIGQRESRAINVLNKVCKDPGNCLDLGPYSDLIKRYFNNFRNLNDIAMQELKSIGKPSSNGFVIEVPFFKAEHGEFYNAYAVLKCAAKAASDNLFYEFYIGKYFINNYLKKLPCFVDTYDCYLFKREQDWRKIYDNVKRTNSIANTNLSQFITLKNTSKTDLNQFTQSCVENKLLCVMIQHFNRCDTFGNYLNDNYDIIKYDIYNILYQVYFGLCFLGNNYTHYDLHIDNVLLYKPFEDNRYVTMKYHITASSTTYVFKTEFIAKIIDYGKNYFNNGEITTEVIIQSNICGDKSVCYETCGNFVGYGYFARDITMPDVNLDEYSWITPTKPNISHDLRLVNSLVELIPTLLTDYDTTLTYVDTYGTPEIPISSTPNSNTIQNIFDMKSFLETIIDGYNMDNSPTKYDSSWKEGLIINIYDDGRDYAITFPVDNGTVSATTNPPN